MTCNKSINQVWTTGWAWQATAIVIDIWHTVNDLTTACIIIAIVWFAQQLLVVYTMFQLCHFYFCKIFRFLLTNFIKFFSLQQSEMISAHTWNKIYHNCTATLPCRSWASKVSRKFAPFYSFLPRDTMCKRGLCCGSVYICLSVTFVHSSHMVEDIVKLLCRCSSPIILIFWPQRRYPISKGTPSTGFKIQWGGKILQFSTEIAVHLGNGTR